MPKHILGNSGKEQHNENMVQKDKLKKGSIYCAMVVTMLFILNFATYVTIKGVPLALRAVWFFDSAIAIYEFTEDTPYGYFYDSEIEVDILKEVRDVLKAEHLIEKAKTSEEFAVALNAIKSSYISDVNRDTLRLIFKETCYGRMYTLLEQGDYQQASQPLGYFVIDVFPSDAYYIKEEDVSEMKMLKAESYLQDHDPDNALRILNQYKMYEHPRDEEQRKEAIEQIIEQSTKGKVICSD